MKHEENKKPDTSFLTMTPPLTVDKNAFTPSYFGWRHWMLATAEEKKI